MHVVHRAGPPPLYATAPCSMMPPAIIPYGRLPTAALLRFSSAPKIEDGPPWAAARTGDFEVIAFAGGVCVSEGRDGTVRPLRDTFGLLHLSMAVAYRGAVGRGWPTLRNGWKINERWRRGGRPRPTVTTLRFYITFLDVGCLDEIGRSFDG